ncbi:hypothetical protein [Peribacillus sp. SCS-37]|uniref:YqgU-like beta propeller domain-containing protein n=1 Tax=Paraperibacillus esterisolvens TaxID=3115296 RepID=UPI0039058A7F
MLLCSVSMLSGCNFSDEAGKEPAKKPQKEERQVSSTLNPRTISSKQYKMTEIAGWLNQETIVFTALQGSQSKAVKHNIKTGEESILFEGAFPISSIKLSPDRKQFLIQTSSRDGKMELLAISGNGEKLHTLSLPAAEVSIQWNPFRSGEYLASAFDRDWTFSGYIVDTSAQKVEEIRMEVPFLQWNSEKEFLFKDIGKDPAKETGPLLAEAADGHGKRKLLDNVLFFQRDRDVLAVLSQEGPEKGRLSFFGPGMETYHKFPLALPPGQSASLHLSINPEKAICAAIVPAESGRFELVVFNWKTGTKLTILKDCPDEPISLSPDGTVCLMGSQLEKAVSLGDHKIYPLYE